MLMSLAIIPSIVLLVYIYKKDKREKEPIKLLIKCFIWGMISIAPVLIQELVIEVFVDELWIEGSVPYAIVDAFLVAAFTEELFKYLVLKITTWKSKHFNCTFDGIVYSVFVSLGFATFENIFYVLDGGLSSALLRMFTAVPGHACDAVFMGYFYSKAKKCEVDNDKKGMRRNKRKALLIPLILHGIYDCLLSLDEEVVGEGILVMSVLSWMVFVLIEFIVSFIIVNNASKKDTYLCPVNISGVYAPQFNMTRGTWICSCRNVNTSNFCPVCGRPRP